jgi:hypothetical protein
LQEVIAKVLQKTTHILCDTKSEEMVQGGSKVFDFCSNLMSGKNQSPYPTSGQMQEIADFVQLDYSHDIISFFPFIMNLHPIGYKIKCFYKKNPYWV